MFNRPHNELVKEWVERTGKGYDEVREALDRVRKQLVDECAEFVRRTCRDRQEAMLRDRRAEFRRFRERVADDWGIPFDTFEAFIVGSTEIGAEINGKIRGSGQTENVAKAEALTRLHARANQIANEILWLCRGGFADGAMARWRSLHEVAVVSVFIAEHEEDLARAYMDFHAIEAERSAAQYEECCEDLGFDHLDEAVVGEIHEAAKGFRSRSGASTQGSYGWASKVLGKKNPSFADIESECALSFTRTFYKYANNNVHAGPTGILHKLGLALTLEDILLAGPSNEGMIDPLQCASLSLIYATEAVMSLQPSFEYDAFKAMFWMWHENLKHELFEAQERLKAKGKV